eukprot:3590947-Pyramimonas_sp.AAC.1
MEKFAALETRCIQAWARRASAGSDPAGASYNEEWGRQLDELRFLLALPDVEKARPSVCRARCWRIHTRAHSYIGHSLGRSHMLAIVYRIS